MNQGVYPWLNDAYVGGIENVKVMTAFRIYGNKWHVYAGLGISMEEIGWSPLPQLTTKAIMNPYARNQVLEYARSVADLFQLVVTEQADAFRTRLRKVSRVVDRARR